MVPASDHGAHPGNSAAPPPRRAARADAAKTSIPKMANIARVHVTRDDEGYAAHFLDFKAGELAACMTSNAQRVSPLGEAGWAEGDLLDVELLRGEEFVDQG